MKKEEMQCCQHHEIFGWLTLILGVLYLFGDLGYLGWFSLGTTGVINWWTAAFLLMGLKHVFR